MGGKRSSGDKDPGKRITLEATPNRVVAGDRVTISGSGWNACGVTLHIGERIVVPSRLFSGFPVPDGVLPAGDGTFAFHFLTLGLSSGEHRLTATTGAANAVVAEVSIEILPRPGPFAPKSEGGSRTWWRAADALVRRFGPEGVVPAGTRDVQIRSVRDLRARRDRLLHRIDPPEPIADLPGRQVVPMGACNWSPVGPAPVGIENNAAAFAGRTLAIALDEASPGTVYIGTANGGAWKSTDSGETWSPLTDYARSPAIGALAIDPNNNLRLLAGTGEFNNIFVSTYYGNGLLRSVDGGVNWTELATATFERDEISRIRFDPTDPTSQRVLLSSSIGVFESLDGGTNWTSLLGFAVSDFVLLVNAGMPQTLTVLAAVPGGIWASTRTAAVWSAWTQVGSAAFPPRDYIGRIAFGQCRNSPRTIYAAIASTDSFSLAGMARSNDGGTTWTAIAPPLTGDIRAVVGRPFPGIAHTHDSIVVPQADLTAPFANHQYTTAAGGAPAHTHTVTVTSAEVQGLAGGGTGIEKLTDPNTSGHQHPVFFYRGAGNQCGYNLHISVHPTDPDTAYFGEVSLWKTATGGGAWTNTNCWHSDQHALAFDPVNPSIVWACNDGGVYRSTNGGLTWQHRNRNLATLQYISLSSHPQWEAVLIGGTQDNGTHRYLGHPVWQFSDGGDGGFTAIDPATPTRMYHEYIFQRHFRSDAAGALNSWTEKTGVIAGDSMFYAPFALDPSNPDICYFGGDRVWRSPDNAENWASISGALPGVCTALAIHPSDPTMLYVGTLYGSVLRIQRTGASWAIANVTVTDLTAAPLAGGVVSDIAVDGAGTVWVSKAYVLSSEQDSFSSDHVFRRAAGATAWESRSTGLAQANPVNCLAIDPADSSRVYCGCDVGVFRTIDAGLTWTPWDEGLPNVPVFDLSLHGPRRLLRAATHGRSIWERPIDTAIAPIVDLYVRDSVLDTGRVQPSPSGHPHPFVPATQVYWWQSPDIKVDAPEGAPLAYQTAAKVTDYVLLETLVKHRSARRGQVSRVYAQVHNRGPSKVGNVKVRAFVADASLRLPDLPNDFWNGTKPFGADPIATHWTPTGPTRTLPVPQLLEAAEPFLVEWDWPVPAGAAGHSCLLVVVTCDEDPINAGGVLNPSILVPNCKHVALKNLVVENALPGTPPMPGQAIALDMHGGAEDERPHELVVDWGSLPKGARLHIAFEESADLKPTLAASDAELQAIGARMIGAKGETLPQARETACGADRRYDLDQTLEISRTDQAMCQIPGVRIPPGGRVSVVFNALLPEGTPAGNVQFDLIQRTGTLVSGGCTCLLRVTDRPPKKHPTARRTKP